MNELTVEILKQIRDGVVTGVGERVDRVGERVDHLESSLGERIDGTNGRLDRVEQGFADSSGYLQMPARYRARSGPPRAVPPQTRRPAGKGRRRAEGARDQARETPRQLVERVAELGAQALNVGLVDEVVGRERQRLLPGVQRLDVAVLGAQRDPEVEQLDGTFQRIAVGGRGRRRCGRRRSCSRRLRRRGGAATGGRGRNASGGSGRLMRSVSASGNVAGDVVPANRPRRLEHLLLGHGEHAVGVRVGPRDRARNRLALGPRRPAGLASSSADSAPVTSRSLLDAPICSSERASAAPSSRALANRSRGSCAVAFLTSSAMLAGRDGTFARGSQPRLAVTALMTSASEPLNGRTPVRHS